MTDTETSDTATLEALREAFAGTTMTRPVQTIVAAGQRRQRRARVRTTALAATLALAVGVPVLSVELSSPPSPATGNIGPNVTSLGLQPAAFVVRAQPDGTVTVTWTKQGYFADPNGLQAALRNAGFPVLVKVGEFCRGPNDDGQLDPSGQGAGVTSVMRPSKDADGNIVFAFVPSALKPGTELFIGYLSPAQLAVTHGLPGSVERIVPTGTALTCTTQAPPAHS